MESIKNSVNSLADFEFKYIPKKEFEKMLTRVERERNLRDTGIWGSFCTVSSGKDDDEELAENYVTKKSDVKVLTDFDIQSVIQSIDKKEITRQIPPTNAPFFGPARKLDVETLQQQQEKLKSSSEEESEASSVHIVEEVNVVQKSTDVKFESEIQVQNHIDDVGGDVGESGCSSINENESLESELIKLCQEINNANGTNSSGDEASVDLTYQEGKVAKNSVDKTEEKNICKKYSEFIDKKFDFLFDECKNSYEEDEYVASQAQTLPVVELHQKPTKSKKPCSDGDFTNDNNVWIPKTENQIRKSGRKQEREKSSVKMKRNGEVFPSDVIIRKALEVGKLKRDSNVEDEVTTSRKREVPESKLRVVPDSSQADLAVALNRISMFQGKICQYLDYLREIVEEPPELEDKNDLRKRQMRATEFSNRFARNHLYQIGRIAEEVRLMPDNPVDVATKVNFLFQVIMQAIQTYLKNVEMIIYNNCPDKLLVLVDFIINAMKVCFDRKVFDKRDLLIQQMMRKCLDMKQYLQMNQQSLVKFASISESRKSSLFSRSSFAFETHQETKLSMYDSKNEKLKPSTSRTKQRGIPSKSPYDIPKVRNVQSHSKVTDRSKVVSRISSRGHSRVTDLKRSLSNVSTAMQKVKNDDSNEALVAEKPLESSDLHAQRIQKSKEMEIMEMMENIAREKIQEMLMPFLSKLNTARDEQQTTFEDPKILVSKELTPTPSTQGKPKPSPRVTSEVENSLKIQQEKLQHKTIEMPEKPQQKERVQRVAKNVQYLFVSSDEMEKTNDRSVTNMTDLQTQEPLENQSTLPPVLVKSNPRTKILSVNKKPPVHVPVPPEKNGKFFLKEMKERALKERLEYVAQMMENPLYLNEMHSEPWKMFAEISDQILDDMIKEVANELDFGEKSFVAKFVQHELEC